METRVRYKGFVIDARPQQLAEDERWTTKVVIDRDTGDAIKQSTFSAAETWATQEEAMEHSWNFGRLIIDGQAEGYVAP